MSETTEPADETPAAPRIERRDRYTIVINDHPVRATEAQEQRLRAMDAAEVDRFLAIMGHA